LSAYAQLIKTLSIDAAKEVIKHSFENYRNELGEVETVAK
jgi:hypothetical protein